jgi:nickel-dependent lactate racemase
MQSINLLSSAWYRDQTVSLDFPDHWEVDVVGDQVLPALPPEAIQNRLLSPIASQPLFELATNHRHVAILIDDLTRPTPTAEILPSLLDELFKGGMQPGQMTIVIAAGTHAPASNEAIQKKVGTRLPAGIQVIPHDGYGTMAYLGKTKSGTPLYLNPVVMGCDLRIGLGCIYPHPSAGFSGGAKALVPGVAGVETIRYLHDNFQGPRQRGGNLDNEFRVEIEQIAAQIGLNFVVNATLNQQRQISGIFAGDMIQAFRQGVDYARQVYAVDVRSSTDIIIADMYPFDADLQFAADRGMWPLEFASKDSSRVILASCPAGLGSHLLFPLQNSVWVRLKRRLRYFGWRDIKSLSYRLAAAYRLISRRSLPLIMVSPGLNAEQLKSAFPSGVLYPDWSNARASLERKYSGRRVKVAVYRCAPLMLPRVKPLARR